MKQVTHLMRYMILSVVVLTTACNLLADAPTEILEASPSAAADLTGDGTQVAQAAPTNTPLPTVAATVTPEPSPTVDVASLARRIRVNPERIRVVMVTSDGTTASALLAPVEEGVEVFVPNPTNSAQYVSVDPMGMMTLFTAEQGQGLPAPFTPFAPANRAANDKLVVNAAWTPDGKSLAVLIDNPDRKSAEDGIYWWEPGVTGANQIMHNCRPGAANCLFFVSSDGSPGNWYATSASWSPDGEELITRAYMDGYGYDGFIMLSRTSDRTHRPPFCPYEFSEWTPDGERIVVSGRDQNALPTLGTILPDCTDFQEAPIWGTSWYTRNGVMRTDGTLLALGRMGSADGPFKLIDGDGNELTPDIGFTAPVEVKWNPASDAVFVRTSDNRAYVASVDGSITDVTEIVGGAKMVNWVKIE